MDYYERRLKGQNLVLRQLKENEHVLFFELLTTVMNYTGLGKRFLLDYLEVLSEGKAINIDGRIGSQTCIIKLNKDEVTAI